MVCPCGRAWCFDPWRLGRWRGDMGVTTLEPHWVAGEAGATNSPATGETEQRG